MAKYISDIINKMFEDVDNFDGVDSTAMNILIQEYLETPQNGYMSEEFTYFDADTTGDITILIDSTSPSISVLEWKQQYFEPTYNQMFLQNQQIAIRDSNSPHYPLVDFKGTLFDFDAATSLDYSITLDTTGDIYIEYEFPAANKIDGMYLQLGDNGCATYGDSTSNINVLQFYIGYSNDNLNWSYVTGSEPLDSTATVVPIITTNQSTAIANSFSVAANCPIVDRDVEEIIFTNTAIEAKYWRLYLVDIYDSLVYLGLESGYTGYTASISHLRFQQIRESGQVVFDKTLPKIKTEGVFASAANASGSTSSGATWFTFLELTITNGGARQFSNYISGRIVSDGAIDVRLQYQPYEGASWVTVDSLSLTGAGMAILMDARELVNPNSDITTLWNASYRYQDMSAGTPNFSYKSASLTTFRTAQDDV